MSFWSFICKTSKFLSFFQGQEAKLRPYNLKIKDYSIYTHLDWRLFTTFAFFTFAAWKLHAASAGMFVLSLCSLHSVDLYAAKSCRMLQSPGVLQDDGVRYQNTPQQDHELHHDAYQLSGGVTPRSGVSTLRSIRRASERLLSPILLSCFQSPSASGFLLRCCAK